MVEHQDSQRSADEPALWTGAAARAVDWLRRMEIAGCSVMVVAFMGVAVWGWQFLRNDKPPELQDKLFMAAGFVGFGAMAVGLVAYLAAVIASVVRYGFDRRRR